MLKEIPPDSSFSDTFTCDVLYTTHMQGAANLLERTSIEANLGGYNVLKGPPKHDVRFYHMMKRKNL